MEFSKKIHKKGGSFYVTLPPEIIEAYDIKQYDLLVLDLKKVIKK